MFSHVLSISRKLRRLPRRLNIRVKLRAIGQFVLISLTTGDWFSGTGYLIRCVNCTKYMGLVQSCHDPNAIKVKNQSMKPSLLHFLPHSRIWCFNRLAICIHFYHSLASSSALITYTLLDTHCLLVGLWGGKLFRRRSVPTCVMNEIPILRNIFSSICIGFGQY